MSNLEQIRKFIPDYIYQVADILNANGYKAYLVGGAVRNILLNLAPKDFDIATDALPEQIEKVFPRCVNVNGRFGTILVIVESKNGERFDVEVTTFRKEEDYVGGRWPAKVEFTDELYVDLSRRDFTINALAIDLGLINRIDAISADIIIDFFAGQRDLQAKIIRAVGDPLERFTEDGLRAFRACRFASVYGFVIEEKTFAAIRDALHVSKMVSIERIRDEFINLLQNSPKPSIGIELMRKTGLLEIFLPEMLYMIGIVQPQFHSDDLYIHSLKSMDLAEDNIRIAALLHDIGKIYTKTEDQKGIHFYGHDVEGAKITEKILTRLKFPNIEIKRIVNLVRWHMFFYPSAQWRKDFTEGTHSDDGGWTDAAIRRFIKNVGEDAIDDLFKLRIADATSNEKNDFDPEELKIFADRISDVRSKDMALKISDLDIRGNDLQSIGIQPGPIMGQIMNKLLDLVIEDPGMNRNDLLLEAAKSIYTQTNL